MATHYATTRRIAPGDVAAAGVGGRAFDAAVLSDIGDVPRVLGQPVGAEHRGGIDLAGHHRRSARDLTAHPGPQPPTTRPPTHLE